MKNYSPADMAIKNMLDGMSHNGSTFPGTEALMKEIGAMPKSCKKKSPPSLMNTARLPVSQKCSAA